MKIIKPSYLNDKNLISFLLIPLTIFTISINFCKNWDQKSFDPNFKSLKLKDFEPYVKKIFNRTPYTQ